MSAMAHCADSSQGYREVREVPIVLQKSPSGLCEIEICNYRIGAPVLLNRCCAFQPDLESIFLAEMLKILLQHNLPCVDGSELARTFFTPAGWSVQPCVRPHMMVSPSRADLVDRDPRWGSHFLQGFPCKPHIRRELIPATVPHSGRGELQENGTTLCRRRCVDGAVAPCRTTATFPRIIGLLCGRSAGRTEGPIRQQALRLRLQALRRR